jgi:excisionase family DNA binding protein
MFRKKEPPPAVKLQSRQKTALQAGVNPRTIDAMIARGELPSVRLGRRVMIPIIAVDRLLSGE